MPSARSISRSKRSNGSYSGRGAAPRARGKFGNRAKRTFGANQCEQVGTSHAAQRSPRQYTNGDRGSGQPDHGLLKVRRGPHGTLTEEESAQLCGRLHERWRNCLGTYPTRVTSRRAPHAASNAGNGAASRTFQTFLNRDAELDERDALYLCRLLGRLGIASGIDGPG